MVFLYLYMDFLYKCRLSAATFGAAYAAVTDGKLHHRAEGRRTLDKW